MTAHGRKLYLDKGSAKLLGVCAGIADFVGTDPIWVRITAVVATLLGSGLPLLAYLIVALLAEAKPHALAD